LYVFVLSSFLAFAEAKHDLQTNTLTGKSFQIGFT